MLKLAALFFALGLFLQQSHDPTKWHPPTTHDHGDEPYTWVNQFNAGAHVVIPSIPSVVTYGGDESSSPMENTHKHEGFKGLRMTGPNNVQAYYRYHAASNPLDRSADKHSFELWIKDSKNNVSFMQGHYNVGFARIPDRNTGVRPVIICIAPGQKGDEEWYGEPHSYWQPDANIMMGATTHCVSNESATAHDMSTWHPTGNKGLFRRASLHWYPGQLTEKTLHMFCTTKEGYVPTDSDPVLLVSGGFGCKSGYIPQYINPTLKDDAILVDGLRRIVLKAETTINCPSCVIPN